MAPPLPSLVSDGAALRGVAQVRLTLRARPYGAPPNASAPPLELVLLSRWPGALVDWNGEEVIL